MNKLLFTATLLLLALPSHADTTVNLKLSTLGFGLEAAFPAAPAVDVRLGLNTYKSSVNQAATSGSVATNYSGHLNLESLEALADWHPWHGSFRATGGLVYNNNNFNLSALAGGGTFYVNGVATNIGAGQYVNASVDFRKVAPYLGIGWGRTPKNTGLSFTSDLGVVFQGSPNGSVVTNIPGATAADINKAKADLNDSLKNFKYYPLVSLGVGYTF